MNMYSAAGKELKKRFFGKFLEDILDYWRIYDYIGLKYKEIWKDKISIQDENHFWYSILSDRFACEEKPQDCFEPKSGQVVQFKDVFLSQWAPKMPGQLWTIEGINKAIEGLKKVEKRVEFRGKVIDVLDLNGKKEVVSAGYGSVRINPQIGNTDFFAYMSLVSARNWNCDQGIPVVVSRPVYDKFLEYSRSGSTPETEGEGILILNQDVPLGSFIPTAIGARLEKDLEDTLRYRPFLPKCWIYISSPLSIKMRFHDKAPNSVAWTLFQRDSYDEPFSFTYATFNPTQKDSIDDAVHFINWYVEEHRGKSIITDFDGIEPKLEAKVKLNSNPMSAHKKELRELISDLARWVKLI
ncbi:MAG TPA: hypothetical protein ACFYD3_06990 [Candidatus Hypogeohydataceae bacterium YC41]